MKKVFLATAALVFSAPAVAADLGPVMAEPVAPAYTFSWSGFYLGGNLGYGWGDSDLEFNTAGFFNLAPGDSAGFDIEGFVGGAHVGYNWQIDNLVFGIETQISFSGIDGSGISPFFPATDSFHTDVDWYWSIAPRLGFAWDNLLFYAEAGYAGGNVETTLIAGGQDSFSDDSYQSGWTVGLGIDYAISPNWVVGLSYNYVDLGSAHSSGLTAAGNSTDQDNDVDFSTVKARLSYKF